MKFLKSLSLSWKGLSFEARGFLVFIPLYIFGWSVTAIYKTSSPKISKLSGYSLFDLVQAWVNFKYPGSVIVLTNINVAAKNIQFWAKVPQCDMLLFLQDIMVLKCKDGTEMKRLIDNIPVNFADAWGFHNGAFICANSLNEEAV